MMRLLRCLLMAAFLLIAFPRVTFAGVTIHVNEVDAGGGFSAVEVSLPWGDYVGIDEGGGVYWVGTYKEYEHARVVGISKDLGFRESRTKIGGATTFVQDRALKTKVGDTAIDGITPSIDFDARTLDPSLRVVNVTWIANNAPVTCFFYVPALHHNFYPDAAHSDNSGGFRNESIVLHESAITQPVLLMFVALHEKPAIIPISSLVKLDYKLTVNALAGLTPTPEQKRHLQSLRILDPALRT